ncbi:hypothetical protein D0Z07_8553 [Hyphodiscus hymeniophilus]|uniref:GH16 domain-containing protein n=1 Tax=Hyphodiscus hymeniophilus TaxID=353542 RepID=A0A9P6VE38_9HELO|nr:hypothetical protein D0Z07_8553 [Hyphodiscus hymeniophilus]
MKAFASLVAASLHLPFVLGAVISQDASSCSCGFYDPTTELLFTDSSIVYFNETENIPTDQFEVEEFEHRYDIGWNTMYRQGAKSVNAEIALDRNSKGSPQGLALYCDPGTKEGLVPGSSIRTARKDIFFGSFRSYMRAPRKWLDGSALSMALFHNKTERWDMDIMNTNNNSQAWVSMVANGEFANTWLGTNFTNISAADMDPWGYLEYRVDWTRDRMDFYIQNSTGTPILWKSYTNSSLPSTPAPLQFQHWSSGNKFTTMGPPGVQAEANIGYTRLFFNSSLANDTSRQAFDERCSVQSACLMDNNSLRGATNYTSEALKPWKQYNKPWAVKDIWIPLLIVISFSGVFAFVTVKTVYRRFSWDELNIFLGRKKRETKQRAPSPATSDTSTSAGTTTTYLSTPHTSHHTAHSTSQDTTNGSVHGRYPRVASFNTLSPPPTYSGTHTPAPMYQTPATSEGPTRNNSVDDLTIDPMPMPLPGHGNLARNDSASSNLYMAGRGTKANRLADVRSGEGSHPETHLGGAFPLASLSSTLLASAPEIAAARSKFIEGNEKSGATPDVPAKESKPETTAAAAVAAAGDKAPLVRQRVDYLAGFIAISAILVTLNHFGQTFWDSVVNPAARAHYSSETWARKTFATYFLDPLWIGPFLMISTRFLVSNYLRTGKLDNMAQKIVSRPFRLLTPVVFIATLEYFLTDSGALNWLEYLPSVTWSQWPFTSIVANPGVFISELLQLAYLIPNAAPNITYNYSTGVLWTIPVQLQGAWQTLLALIMVKECKTPWKRFAFYSFCIVNHWYALSWGSYYYAGVLLADLDLTFKYKTWLYARWWAYYPLLLFLIACTLGGFTIDMIVQWTGVNYATYEYGWHPDIPTGLPLSQAGNAVYPDYFIPRLNALIVTVAMQMVVEICPSLQKVLSIKPLQWLFPHVFTIYLIHGFIFWSVGSWACVTIFNYGLPYWATGLLTGSICYFVLFACLPFLTPPIEAVGKNFTLSLWEHASQEPVPRKPTSYPFGESLLKRDVEGARETASADDPNRSIGEKSDPFRDPDQKRNPFADPSNPFVDPPKKKGAVFEIIEEV